MPEPDLSTPEFQFIWHMVEAYVLRNPEKRQEWGEDIETLPYHDHWLCKSLNDAHETKVAFTLAAITLAQTHFSPNTTRVINGPPGSWFFQNSDKDFINLDRHAMMGMGMRRSLIVADHETGHAKHSHHYPALITDAHERTQELYEKSKKEELTREEYYAYLQSQLEFNIYFSIWNAIEDNLVDLDALQDHIGFQSDIPRKKASDFNFLMMMMNGIDTPQYMRELEARRAEEEQKEDRRSETEKKSATLLSLWEKRLANLKAMFLFPITLQTGMIENKPAHWEKMRVRLDWITDDPDSLPIDEDTETRPDHAFEPEGNEHVGQILDAIMFAEPVQPAPDEQAVSFTTTDEIINAVLSGTLESVEDYTPPTIYEQAIAKLKPSDSLLGFGRSVFELQAKAHSEKRAVKINELLEAYARPIVRHILAAELAQNFSHSFSERIPASGAAPPSAEDLTCEMEELVNEHKDVLEERLTKINARGPKQGKDDLETAFKDAAEKAAKKGHKHPGYAKVDGLGYMPIDPPPGLGQNGYDELDLEMQEYIDELLAEGLTIEQLSQLRDKYSANSFGQKTRNPLLPSPGSVGQGGYFSKLEVLDWTQDWNTCISKLAAPIAKIEHLLKDIQDVQWEKVVSEHPDLHLFPQSSLRDELSHERAKQLALKLARGTAALSDHYLMETHPPEPIPVETIIFQMGDGSGSMGSYSEVVNTPMGAVTQIMCMTSQACDNLTRRADFHGGIHNYGGIWGPGWSLNPQSPPLLFKPWDSFETKRNRIGAAAKGLGSGTDAGPSLDRVIHTILEDEPYFGPYIGQVHGLYYSDGDIFDAAVFAAKAQKMFETLPYFTLNVLTMNPKRTNMMYSVVQGLQKSYGENRVRYVHCNDPSQAADAAVSLLTDIVRTHQSLAVMPTDKVIQDYRQVKSAFDRLIRADETPGPRA